MSGPDLRVTAALLLLALGCRAGSAGRLPDLSSWPVHSTDRPRPPVVDPGPAGPPAPAPGDAVVLFDGRSLDGWVGPDGGPAHWALRDGVMEVRAGGNLQTRRSFGDCQLHVEWAAPSVTTASGQGGNSGVYLMGLYEVQVLNSWRNDTYADGQAAAVYGQYPPRVNASRAPGEWQSYDIVWRRPRFDPAGRLLQPATLTVFHNGVLVQDHVTLTGPTAYQARPPYRAHPDRLPLLLQDHGDPVRFRNIWIRELE